MPTQNKRFSVQHSPRTERRMLGRMYENGEERQYYENYETRVDAWDVMVDDRVLKTFYSKNSADTYLFEQLTIPGINSIFQKRRKILKAQIRELEKSLKELDTDRKGFIEKRNALLRTK